MSTDSQGRPLSDDGQWAWNGTEWVPAHAGPDEIAAGPAEPAEPADAGLAGDPGATMIAPSPFAAGNAPGYGGQPQGYGAVPAGAAPVYGGAPPAGYGAAPQQPGSRKKLIITIASLVVVVAVVVVVIVLVTTGGSKKTSLSGPFVCTAPGTTQTGTITFTGGNRFSLSSGGANGGSGTYTRNGKNLTFHGTKLDMATGTLDSVGKAITITIPGGTLTCTQ